MTNEADTRQTNAKTERIVVGIDGSAGARAAIDWALSHARANDQIDVIHTWSQPAMPAEAGASLDPRLFADTAAAILKAEMALVQDQRSDLHIKSRCVQGHSGKALIEEAEGADLLVVGTRGHGGFVGLLLGSTSTYLAHHATCPLVIVPAGDRSHDG